MKTLGGNFSSVLIILMLSISLIGTAGTASGVDDIQEGGTRGVIIPPIMAEIEPGELFLQPGENATCEVTLFTCAYTSCDIQIWLEGVPRIMTVTLDNTEFSQVYGVNEVNTTLRVSIPENSPVDAGITIMLHGYLIDGNYTSNLHPVELRVIIKGSDLSIKDSRIIFSHNNPRGGQEINITVWIINIGEVEASNITVKFFIDDDPVGVDKIIRTLSIDVVYMISETWTATPGDHIVFVKIDTENSIREYSEHNNFAITNISVVAKQSYVEYCAALFITLCITALGVRRIVHRKKD